MSLKIAIATLLLSGLCMNDCWAFWGREAVDPISGLDVAGGFDINTVTTMTGTALSVPGRTGEQEHTVMTMKTEQGPVTVLLGPWWYWDKQSFRIERNQELAITGSRAQGKDGSLYLFAQKVANRSSGTAIVLRSDTGSPAWSGSGPGSRGSSRQPDGSGYRSGTAPRGSGYRGGRR